MTYINEIIDINQLFFYRPSAIDLKH